MNDIVRVKTRKLLEEMQYMLEIRAYNIANELHRMESEWSGVKEESSKVDSQLATIESILRGSEHED